MRNLIVNADDLGLSRERNAGIAEAIRAGAVTSVSLLANLDGFEDAVELLRTLPPVDVGLHFNLSEGRPLGAEHQTLLGADGCFPGKAEARRRASSGEMRPGEIASECNSQWVRMFQAVGQASHIDGHQHIHVYGNVAETLSAYCHPSHWARIPSEPGELSTDLTSQRRAQIDEYRSLAGRARALFAATGWRTADHFRGLAISGRMTPEGLAALVRGLPEGTTELMVHPGRASAPSGFEGPDREAELAALLSPEFRRALAEGGIALVRRGSVA